MFAFLFATVLFSGAGQVKRQLWVGQGDGERADGY